MCIAAVSISLKFKSRHHRCEQPANAAPHIYIYTKAPTKRLQTCKKSFPYHKIHGNVLFLIKINCIFIRKMLNALEINNIIQIIKLNDTEANLFNVQIHIS